MRIKKELNRTEKGSKSYIPIITLNNNGLKSPIKKHTLAKWIKNKIQQYAGCKRLISKAKGKSVGKKNPTQME